MEPSTEALRKGDVYAFGIVLFEIMGLRGPWGKREMTGRDVDGELETEREAGRSPISFVCLGVVGATSNHIIC